MGWDENGLPDREWVASERTGCLRENGLPERERVAERERVGMRTGWEENGLG